MMGIKVSGKHFLLIVWFLVAFAWIQQDLQDSAPWKKCNLIFLPASAPRLGKLPHLQMLMFDQNQLTGQIPKELGELKTLIQLRLHENRLSGSIPPELGQLVKLHEIRLEQNQLRGDSTWKNGQVLTDVKFGGYFCVAHIQGPLWKTTTQLRLTQPVRFLSKTKHRLSKLFFRILNFQPRAPNDVVNIRDWVGARVRILRLSRGSCRSSLRFPFHLEPSQLNEARFQPALGGW